MKVLHAFFVGGNLYQATTHINSLLPEFVEGMVTMEFRSGINNGYTCVTRVESNILSQLKAERRIL